MSSSGRAYKLYLHLSCAAIARATSYVVGPFSHSDINVLGIFNQYFNKLSKEKTGICLLSIYYWASVQQVCSDLPSTESALGQ